MPKKRVHKAVMEARASAKAEAVVKASYQRKRITTEIIPPDVTRAKAGAWLSLISPITEWAGLKGDALRYKRAQLRVQQEAALEALAEGVQKRMEQETVVQPLPSKILVPAIEAVSLEDAASPLIEWWADLLVSGATKQGLRPFLVDLMKAIGTEEAAFLEGLWSKFSKGGFRDTGKVDNSYFSGMLHGIIDRIERTGFEQEKIDRAEGVIRTTDARRLKIGTEYVERCDEIGACALISLPNGDGRAFFYSKGVRSGPSLDVCRSLKILEDYSETVVPFSSDQRKVEAHTYFFSDLGVEFMRACRPVKARDKQGCHQ